MKRRKRHILPPDSRRNDIDSSSVRAGREIFRLWSLNEDFPVGCRIILNTELIWDILETDRHLTVVDLVSYSLRERGSVNWTLVYADDRTPPEVVDRTLAGLRETFGGSSPRLTEELIITIHRMVQMEYLRYFQPVEYEGEPVTAEEFASRGIMNSNNGLIDDAIDDFSRAIELDGRNPVFYFNRGLCCRRRNRFEEALSDIEIAVELSERDDMHFTLACHYYRVDILTSVGDIEKAIDLMKNQLYLVGILIEDVSWDRDGFTTIGSVETSALPFDGLLKEYIDLCERMVDRVPDYGMKADICRMRSKFIDLHNQL